MERMDVTVKLRVSAAGLAPPPDDANLQDQAEQFTRYLYGMSNDTYAIHEADLVDATRVVT